MPKLYRHQIVGNSISDSIIEGLTFNENYTYGEGASMAIVENNAIYNNAKGPSMIILGEVSANPQEYMVLEKGRH